MVNIYIYFLINNCIRLTESLIKMYRENVINRIEKHANIIPQLGRLILKLFIGPEATLSNYKNYNC